MFYYLCILEILEFCAAIFPRINIRDPYKRLGISREASEEEIQAARNFLIQRYGGHKPSVDAIESAHDKVIMQKFYERRNPKIDIKKHVRAVKQSPIVQAVRSSFRTPSTSFIIKTFAAFAILGALTVLFPTEDGPTVQVAMSLVATIYFMHDQLKSVWRALFYGYDSDFGVNTSMPVDSSFFFRKYRITIFMLLVILAD